MESHSASLSIINTPPSALRLSTDLLRPGQHIWAFPGAQW